jgi:outer membrane protein assembly factor BamB
LRPQLRPTFQRFVSLLPILLILIVGRLPSAVRADDWPQWLGPQRDGVWRETGIIERFPAGGPRTRWRVETGAGYAGPAVAEGRVFLADRVAPAEVAKPKSAFDVAEIPGRERVLCLRESDGATLWKHDYDCPYTVSYAAGPRATPTVDGRRVFTLGTMGNLFCFDTVDGRVVWSRDFKKDFGLKVPIWGCAAHPLVDGRKLICVVGGEGSVAVAFDRETGKELWRALSAKEPGYCPPVIATLGGRRQLIIWHAEAVNGLDPETGAALWTEPWPLNFALAVPTPRTISGDRLFLTSFYNGSMLLKFEPDKAAPSVAWRTAKMSERDTTHLNSIMCTPFIEDGHVYGACSYGQFRCLELETGARKWETFAPTTGKAERWGNAFVVKNGARFFLVSEQGDLIIARLSPAGYEEISRAHVIEPTNRDPGRPVVWSHPAFANRCVYLRNDRELICLDLAARN